MKLELRERRDRAGKRHDAVRARDPKGQSATTLAEVQAVIDELEAVIAEADGDANDPVELSRTYRWLADAYGNLCEFGADKQHCVKRADDAYRNAEQLIVNQAAPVEQAKLNFNFAEHLWRTAGRADVHLLEAAIARFADAAKVARANNLLPMAQAADVRIERLNSMLPVMRSAAKVLDATKNIDELEERLKNAGPIERQRISNELAKIEATMMQGDPVEMVETAFDELAVNLPGQDLDEEGSALLVRFKEQFEAMLECAEPAETNAADLALFDQARAVIQQGKEAGELSEEGTDFLKGIVNKLQEYSYKGLPEGKTLADSVDELGKIQELLDQVTAYAADRNRKKHRG